VFEKLPGQGQPLNLDDDLLIPEELRMVCRVLKNSAYVPPEIEELKQLRQLEAIVASDALEGERLAARRRMEFLLMKLEQSGLARVAQATWDEYAGRVATRMGGLPSRDGGDGDAGEAGDGR
jgi:hypothetical protein